MIWQGSSLLDGPTTVAEATADAVVCGAVTLKVCSTAPSNFLATAPDGSTYRVEKAGLTVSRYRAHCDGRSYALNRTSGKRREILDAEGRVIARTRGLPNGDLEVGTLTAFQNYLIQILTAFMMATFMLMLWPRAEVSAERITEVVETVPSILVDPTVDAATADVRIRTGRVEVRDASYA